MWPNASTWMRLNQGQGQAGELAGAWTSLVQRPQIQSWTAGTHYASTQLAFVADYMLCNYRYFNSCVSVVVCISIGRNPFKYIYRLMFPLFVEESTSSTTEEKAENTEEETAWWAQTWNWNGYLLFIACVLRWNSLIVIGLLNVNF